MPTKKEAEAFWLLKIFRINKGNFNSCIPLKLKRGSGIGGSFLLGIPFGISASPCTLPVTLSILAFSLFKGSSLYGIIYMFTFAMGRSLPLLLVGTFTGMLKNMQFIYKYQETIEKISGVILLALAFYFIWQG